MSWSLPGVPGLVELLFPAECPGCGRRGGALCADCRDTLIQGPRACVPRAGCPAVWAAGPYAGRVRRLVLAFKTRGYRALAEPLGSAMAGIVADAYRGAVPGVLVPVPPRRGSVRRRGYDPVRLLAVAVAGALAGRGHPVVTVPALRHRRRVRDQVGLSARGRRVNLTGAFEVRHAGLGAVRGRRVLVVDDIVTTGTTAAEAVRALRAAHLDVAGVVVAAES